MKVCPICVTMGRNQLERFLNSIALLKCESCGFVYADLSEEIILEVNSGYDVNAKDGYDLHQTFLDEMWFMRIASRLTNRLGLGRVLDVGCGNGRLLYHFGRLGWDCCGIDTSPWIKNASELYGVELFQGTIESMSDQMGKFDLVVSSSTLEHIAEPIPHIEAISEVLKMGGLAYFCGIPNYASLSVRLGFSTFHMNQPPGHVNFFTPATLHKLFQFASASFQNVTVRTYGIPELHRAYNAMTMFIRKRHNVSMQNVPVHSPHTVASSGQQQSGIQKPLSRFALGALYHIGRIASVGDKLETTAINCSDQ